MIGNIDVKSTDEGCFTRPNSVCIDAAGNFIVADSNRLQVKKDVLTDYIFLFESI